MSFATWAIPRRRLAELRRAFTGSPHSRHARRSRRRRGDRSAPRTRSSRYRISFPCDRSSRDRIDILCARTSWPSCLRASADRPVHCKSCAEDGSRIESAPGRSATFGAARPEWERARVDKRREALIGTFVARAPIVRLVSFLVPIGAAPGSVGALERLRERFERADVDVRLALAEVPIRCDEPTSNLEGFYLVVLGTENGSLFQRLLFVTVSNGVVRMAPSPLFNAAAPWPVVQEETRATA